MDDIGFQIEHFLLEFLSRHHKPHDQVFLLRQSPVTMHVPFGKVDPGPRPTADRPTSNFPKGSPHRNGMDVKGPTVALASMARARTAATGRRGGRPD